MILTLEARILISLWKWKLLPTAAIAQEFWNSQYSDAAYKKLRSLRSQGFVQTVCLENKRIFFWTLTTKGFSCARNFIPELREVGFRSEALIHDYLCSALQRGHWLSHLPDGVTLNSEQELRRFHPEHLGQHLPSSTLHRPDGYTVQEQVDGIAITAIEVELNHKAAAQYAAVGSFYSPDEVTRVLWLTSDLTSAKSIQRMLTVHHPERAVLHQFVLLQDFMKDFWNSPVQLGTETGRRIHELFSQPASPSLLTGEKHAMLDLRLRPYSSMRCRKSSDSRFLNRVALGALLLLRLIILPVPHQASQTSPVVPLTSHPKTLEVYPC